jgi:hypothetical protein
MISFCSGPSRLCSPPGVECGGSDGVDLSPRRIPHVLPDLPQGNGLGGHAMHQVHDPVVMDNGRLCSAQCGT